LNSDLIFTKLLSEQCKETRC